MSYRRRTGRPLFLAAAVSVALLTSACGNVASSSRAATPITGGTVTFAENESSGSIDWIFPLNSLAVDLPSNVDFQYLQWEPLYWFGQHDSFTPDPSLSLAEPPVYSDGNTAVTITLKPARWSDGKPVTSRDVEFFINLARADESSWSSFVSGEFPANVRSVRIDSSRSLTLYLTKAYSPTWYTDSQLADIIPLPQQAWDKTGPDSPVSNYDLTPSGAGKVLRFLLSEAKDTNAYDTNKLWQIVDGPWHLVEYRPDGYTVLKPNRDYDIAKPPTIGKFVMESFTSDAAEANELSTGQLTYGYVPFSDLAASSRFTSAGYHLSPWPLLSISYIVLNFNNPMVGPALRQLYVRQAMQSLIDQPGYLKSFLGRAGVPDYGPVPIEPPNPYATSAMHSNPYPYSPHHAVELLKSHGWRVVPNGTTSCVRPGTSPTECGPGVADGTKLQLALQYVSGLPYLSNIMQSLKSAMSLAGITVSLSEGTEGQVVGTATACTGGPTCDWQAVQWGTPSWIWDDPYPTGGQLFATGAGVNAGSFSNGTVDAEIRAVQTAPTQAASKAAWAKYQTSVAHLLPVLWLPNTVNQVSAISSKLEGATPQNSLGYLAPSTWTLTK